MSVPLWCGPIRGKFGLIESLYLSNGIRKHSDSLEVIAMEHEDADKSEEIKTDDRLNALELIHLDQVTFCISSLFQDRRKRTRNLNCSK